jgi:hypothetical protein
LTATRRITGGTGGYKEVTGRLQVRGSRSAEGITTARWRGYAINCRTRGYGPLAAEMRACASLAT